MAPLSMRSAAPRNRVRETRPTPFGARLGRLRRDRGLTQTELAEAIGTTQRVISYYERRANRPPAHLLIKLAEALEVSVDDLVGLTPAPAKPVARNARLWRRLRDIEKLAPADRKAVLRMVDALLARQRSLAK